MKVSVFLGLMVLCIFNSSCGRIWGGITWYNQSCTGAPLSVIVSANYPNNGLNWNDYVHNDGTTLFNATDSSSCTGAEVPRYGIGQGCIHGGEIKKVPLPGYSSCSGITAQDSLGAFNWTCNMASGVATFYSSGLNSTMGLKNLVTTSSWIPNSINVYQNNCLIAQSAPATWWSNIVQQAPNSSAVVQTLNSGATGTIYTIPTNTVSYGYNLNSNKTALVTINGSTLQFNAAAGNNFNDVSGKVAGATDKTVVGSGSVSFIWIEGNFDENNATTLGVGLASDSFAVIWGSVIENSAVGNSLYIRFAPSSSHLIANTSFINNLGGTFVGNGGNGSIWENLKYEGNGNASNLNISGSQVTVNNIWAANNAPTNSVIGLGVGGTSSAPSVVSNIYSYNNNGNGILFSGSNVTATNILAVNNNGYGIQINSTSGTYVGLTLLNNSFYGILLNNGTTQNSISNVVTANNSGGGILDSSGAADTEVFNQAVLVNNTGAGIVISNNSTTSAFGGNLIVGNNNGSANLNQCSVTAGSTGLTNSTCTPLVGGAAFINSASVSSSFVGALTSHDNANGSNNGVGQEAYASITDWFNFSNVYRAWGLSGAFPTAAIQNWCSAGTCQIWDWRVSALDNVIRNTTGNVGTTFPPTQNPTFVDGGPCPSLLSGALTVTDFATPTPHTFLMNAIELNNDSVHNPNGNNNGLCESGEGCLYLQNFGTYQGEGSFGSHTCVFDNAGLANITIYHYPTNGG